MEQELKDGEFLYNGTVHRTVQCACGATRKFLPESAAAWEKIGWRCDRCAAPEREAALAAARERGLRAHTPAQPVKRKG